MTRKKFNNIKSLINGIYYYAIEEGIVSHNPVKDISSRNFTFKAVNHSDDVFTLNERKKLLTHLAGNDDMYSLAVLFSLWRSRTFKSQDKVCTASILYSNGMDLPTLQRLLGHSTAAMSMHYLRHVTPTTDTDAIMTSALS